MKRMVKDEYNIDVIVEYDIEYVPVSASTIKPITDKSDRVYTQALADYDAFIEEIEYRFDDYDFIVVQENKSNQSDTSRYYKLANEPQWKSNTAKYVLALRISDHEPELTDEQKKKIRDKNKAFKEQYKIIYKVKNILVNGLECDSYDDAVDKVCESLEYYQKMFEKNPKGDK